MISAVTDLESLPPRNVITVSVSDPLVEDEVIQTITIYRVQDGIRTALRQQPVPGSSEIVAYDYEAPFGVVVTYEWAGTYVDLAGLVLEFSESWADTSEWAASGNMTWAVDTDQLTVASGGSDRAGALVHELTPDAYRVTFDSLPLDAGDLDHTTGMLGVELDLSPRIKVRWSPGYSAPGVVFGDSIQLIVDSVVAGTVLGVFGATLDAPVVIDVSDSVVAMTVDGVLFGSATGAGFTVTGITFSASASTAAGPFALADAISVESYGAVTDVAGASEPVAMPSDRGWLIHPTRTNISVPLDRTSVGVDVASLGEVDNGATQTIHRVIGASRPTVNAAGPRLDDELTLTLATATADQRIAVRTLLADQTPILINIPPSWGYELDYGFYAVGTTSTQRLAQMPDLPDRRIVMPLIAVDPPLGGLVETGWSNAQLAIDFATNDEMLAAFASNNDLLLNVRREV